MSDINLESWMTNLPPALRTTPIIHLAIPGSHDSGTFGITPDSKIAPDAETILQILDKYFGCIVGQIVTQWSVTQYYTIRQQLYKGIRYFDCRISTSTNSDLFYIVHGLFAETVDLVFQEINNFLELHPKEVVFIDCQHFYSFQDYDHKRFTQLAISIFGQKLQPYSKDMKSLTLESMTDNGQYQVIFVYRESSIGLAPQFWPSECLPNPWANTMVPTDLTNYLTEHLASRDYGFGYVSQCILTPSSSDILENLFSDLMTKCLLPLEEEKYKWLIAQKPGVGGINIVISDFVDYEADKFAKAVIGLNAKMGDINIQKDVEKVLKLEENRY